MKFFGFSVARPTIPKLEPITISEDGQEITLAIRVSIKAKNIRIKINQKHEAELVIPKISHLAKAKAFLQANKSWVFQRLTHKKPEKILFAENVVIPVLGKEYVIKHSGDIRGKTSLIGDKLLVGGRSEFLNSRVRRFLIELITQEIKDFSQPIADKLGVKVRKITVRDTTSIWGSCTKTGNVSFSWRLIFAPLPAFHYVVVHELCHLREHNHSKKFWDLVASVDPGYKTAQHWLKKNGSLLFRYD